MSKTMYFDSMRGPIACKPVERYRRGSVDYLIVQITTRNAGHIAYHYGERIEIPSRSLVYLLSNQRCRTVPVDDYRESTLFTMTEDQQ